MLHKSQLSLCSIRSPLTNCAEVLSQILRHWYIRRKLVLCLCSVHEQAAAFGKAVCSLLSEDSLVSGYQPDAVMRPTQLCTCRMVQRNAFKHCSSNTRQLKRCLGCQSRRRKMRYKAATRRKSQSSSCSNLHSMQLLKGWWWVHITAATLRSCWPFTHVEDQGRALDTVVCGQSSYRLQSLAYRW